MSFWTSFRKTWRTYVHQKICSFLLIKVQIFTKFHESTMKNCSMMVLRKLTKEQLLVRKEKLTKNQSNLQNISEQFAEHLGICRTSRNLQSISEFAEHLGIADRMECYSDHHAFITLNTIKTTLKITPRADS